MCAVRGGIFPKNTRTRKNFNIKVTESRNERIRKFFFSSYSALVLGVVGCKAKTGISLIT